MKLDMMKCAAIAASLVLAAGCETLTPRLDAGFGDAVNVAKARQALDRAAPQRNASRMVAGVDGVVARDVMDRYHKSFRDPEPQTSAFTIGVSGSSSP